MREDKTKTKDEKVAKKPVSKQRKNRGIKQGKPRERLKFTEEEKTFTPIEEKRKKGKVSNKELSNATKKKRQKRLYKNEQKKISKLILEEEMAPVGQKPHSNKSLSRVLAVADSAEIILSHSTDTKVDDDSGTKALRDTPRGAGYGYRFISSRIRKHQRKAYKHEVRLKLKQGARAYYERRVEASEPTANSYLGKLWQKKQIKREYIKAYRAEKFGSSGVGYIYTKGKKVLNTLVANKHIILPIIALFLIFIILFGMLSSCSVSANQMLTTTFMSSYCSDVTEIEKTEIYYTQLEAKLQQKINRIEKKYPGKDEYNYNIGEIGHDPHQLISYLSAKYEVFTFEQVKPELESLFEAQYHIKIEELTDERETTKTIKVGESLGSVMTSGYCGCAICCGKYAGGPTASGVMPRANHTIAVDAKNPTVPMGTKVVMNGIEYTVEDTGNFARYGVDFDIYYDNHSEATAHGHRTWEAYLAEGNSNTVELTKVQKVEMLNTTLTAKPLRSVCLKRMNDEEKEMYDLIYSTKGNLQIYKSPLPDLNWYSYLSLHYGNNVNASTGESGFCDGVLISVNEGTSVSSGQTGIVIATGYDKNLGNYIITQSKKGYMLKYGHLSNINVSKGQEVKAGDIIGATGATGSATGSQLYLELQKEGVYYNPIFYVDTGSGGLGGGGKEYDDATVQALFDEAEKYLGMPYVWGGSSPSTSFDCSGFVSYVYTNSGVYPIGRQTAQGIYNLSTPIDASEARPGDLIFFTGTYNSNGPVSHIGIYAGDGQMLHCGDPIQYTSVNSAYWQQHFYGFGRLVN